MSSGNEDTLVLVEERLKVSPSSWEVIEAFVDLIIFDTTMLFRGFRAVHRRIANLPVASHSSDSDVVERLMRALALSCVYYPSRKACLPRSAVLTCMLRRRGVPAKLILAGRRMPTAAHAWVEIRGIVVNDRQDVQKTYGILDKI